MASRARTAVEWYQTDTEVRASVLIKGLPPNEPITPTFEAYYCAIHVGGEVYWEAELANSISPEKCSLGVGKIRAELKMRKAEPMTWSDFEATATALSGNPKSDCTPQKTSQYPSSSPSSSSSPSLASQKTAKTTSTTRKTFNKNVQNDFVYLNHLRHDWIDKGEGEVRTKVMVAHVTRETCTVDFKERQLELLFQTADENFLSGYTGSSQTTFIWKVQLYDAIEPEACHYQVTPKEIIIVLKKSVAMKWKSLERLNSFSSSLSNLSSNSNSGTQVTRADPPINRNASSDSNSMTSETNDLDAVDDVVATPLSSQVQTNGIRSTSQMSSNRTMLTPPSDGEPLQNFHTNPLYTVPDTRHGVPQRPQATSPASHDVPKQPQAISPPSHDVPKQPQAASPAPHDVPKQPQATTPPSHNAPKQPQATSPPSHNAPKQPQATNPPSHNVPVMIPSEMETSNPAYRNKQLSQPSTTGLLNLGNSCFMNSVLQCLSNTPELRDFFVSGRYLANINSENPLGFEGKLAKCFCRILRQLWSGEYEYFSPKKLLEIVAKRSEYFGGNSQHDTHEFMSYLIDGLHEDLNKVRKKPVTKPVDMENQPDREMAAESWRVHKMRNDSMMVDLFQGQFKSTLVCQECNKESVTFDPFLSLSVPIPRNLRHLAVIFIPRDPDITPRQLILQLPPEATLKLLKASVARRTSLSMAQLRVFEVYKGKFQSVMADNSQLISAIKSSDIIIVAEVLSKKSSRGGVIEVNVVQRVQVAPFPTKCGYCGSGAEEGRRLQRCGKCLAVAYCHKTCQQKDWDEHRLKCGRSKAYPIGHPFIISLHTRELTFARLTEYAEKFASHSVTVTRRHPQPHPYQKQTSRESIQGSAESILTSEASMQESAESILTSEASMQESAESILTSEASMQESTGEDMEVCTEGRPMYTLSRVDRFLEPVSGAHPLENRGDVPLEFNESPVYLTMDWRNGTKEKDGVDVTPRTAMEYVEDQDENAARHSGTISLTDCLQLFTEPETLSQDEAWYCPCCKKHRPAIKQMSVWRLPRFLVIHLKRFSFHNSVWRSKINHLVTFPLSGLDMSPYLLGDAAKDISPETPPIYDLYATVNHYGNIYIGHYVATVKPPLSEENDWLCYDDHNVWKMSKDKIQCSEAYVLFYRRRDRTTAP